MTKTKKLWIPWLMVLPVILIRGGTTIYPVIQTFINSFRDLDIFRGGSGSFIGFDNYTAMLQDQNLKDSLGFTLIFTVVSMLFHIVIGVLLGMLVNQKFKGKKFLRTIVLIPWAIPMIVAGRAARWAFNGKYGFVNDLISRLIGTSFHFDWLIHFGSARMAVIFVDLWKDVPFFTILVLAALQYISDDVYEAARIDGAGAVRVFFNITVPFIARTVLTISIFFTMWRVATFELVYGMTSGGPGNATSVLSYRIMIEAFNNLNLGYASAISVVLFLIMLVFSALNMLAVRKLED